VVVVVLAVVVWLGGDLLARRRRPDELMGRHGRADDSAVVVLSCVQPFLFVRPKYLLRHDFLPR